MQKKKTYGKLNTQNLTGIRPTVEALLGLKTTRAADFDVKPVERVLTLAKLKFGERQQRVIDCDRVFIYNPDAVASWVFDSHISIFRPLTSRAGLTCDMLAMEPPVTPVCFASMYSGKNPEEHGIRSYKKPVLKVNTLFDDLAAAGKKVAIICTAGDSIAEIFKERNVDYFIYEKTAHCNMKALELILEDRHDMIVLYNGNYDAVMHKKGPESKAALQALRENVGTFCEIHDAIEKHWTGHNTVLAFAPDHGCHKKLFGRGDHGKNIPEDMNIKHFYSFIQKKED